MMTTEYIGNELELFSRAVNWKRYFASRITPWLGGMVLEVGAGLAETTRWVCDGSQAIWLCLEPDEALFSRIRDKIAARELPGCCSAVNGTLDAFEGQTDGFDSILYIDVLEHIQDDAAELKRAAGLLHDKGRIIIIAPAHDALYSPFDRQIGHYRRYAKRTIRKICPPELSVAHLEYLDSVGMVASLANRLLLRQTMPTHKQIAFWDRVLVPVSRIIDPILLHSLGKSLLAVLRTNTSVSASRAARKFA